MLTLILPDEITRQIFDALSNAGRYEIGGVLMGEHTGLNEFKVAEITIQRRGTFSSFIRRIEDALGKLKTFFKLNHNDYSRFNYLGEWHSHPMFIPYPSTRDDNSMFEIVMDKSIGANFAILLIVKLESDTNRLVGTVHTYLPNGGKTESTLIMNNYKES